jgi:hypothetical protein
MKSVLSQIATALLIVVSGVFLYYVKPPDLVLHMELGQKLFYLSLYNFVCMVGLTAYGGFNFDTIGQLMTSRRATAWIVGAWMIGNALVIKG